jgi:predicted ArsR family transcriptional regulator
VDWVTTLLGGTRARILGLLRRSHATIGELADGVGVTGNAVRGHLAALQKDGLVREVGTARSTGGKPAHLYDLTPEGEELFPKAYAIVLQELIRTLEEREGREAMRETLRAVGRRAARRVGEGNGSREARVVAAADVLRALGAEVTVARQSHGWEIRGIGCPLSGVVVHEPELCGMVEAMIGDITGAGVSECCDRSEGRARCTFVVAAEPAVEG